jgi:hypothetical protein
MFFGVIRKISPYYQSWAQSALIFGENFAVKKNVEFFAIYGENGAYINFNNLEPELHKD